MGKSGYVIAGVSPSWQIFLFNYSQIIPINDLPPSPLKLCSPKHPELLGSTFRSPFSPQRWIGVPAGKKRKIGHAAEEDNLGLQFHIVAGFRPPCP
jgi:hypothetical protein